jgi:hypothetical protein
MSEVTTILLLDGSTIQRVIKQYNGAYYVRYLCSNVPVARDKVEAGKQTYKQVTRFKDAY